MNSARRAVVIGGGISGLAAAYRLQQKTKQLSIPLDIQLLEGSAAVGGVIRTERRDGFLLEGGPDAFFTQKPQALRLCRDLGLQDDLIETTEDNRRSFIFHNSRLHPIPDGFFLLAPTRLSPFLKSTLLSWPGKLRILMEPLMPFRPATDESLASFVRRRLGSEALDRLAQPLIASIYGANAEKLSLAATFPQFLNMEREHLSLLEGVRRLQGSRQASGARYSLFMTLRGGMQELTDRLAAALGPIVRLNAAVRRASFRDQQWILELQDGSSFQADAVICALPAYAAAEVFSPDLNLTKMLRAIPYAHAITANCAYDALLIRRPLNGFGFVVPAVEKKLLLGCTFAHQKFIDRAPAGMALLRAFLAGDSLEAIWKTSDDQIMMLIEKDLREILDIRGKPTFIRLRLHRLAMPQYRVGHRERVDVLMKGTAGWKGFAFAGSWINGIGVPDCIASGEAAADRLLAGKL